jgi:hypothetical protein
MSLRGVTFMDRGRVGCPRLCYAGVMNTQRSGPGQCWSSRSWSAGERGSHMKLVYIALVATLAGCGGEVIGPGGTGSSNSGGASSGSSGGSSATGGSAGSGSSSGTGGSDNGGSGGAGGSASTPTDGGSSLPDAGSPACDLKDGNCVLCSDELWHCGGQFFPPCEPNAEVGAACGHPQFASCIICLSDGTGDHLQCSVSTSAPRWLGTPISCLP